MKTKNKTENSGTPVFHALTQTHIQSTSQTYLHKVNSYKISNSATGQKKCC